MVMYAQLNALKRIISLCGEPADGLVEVDNADVINNPQDYKYVDGVFVLDAPPSQYHALNANGDWYLNNEVLQNAKEMMWQRIKSYRDEREEGGVKVTANGADYWFHSDTRSLIKYLFLLFLATVFSSYFTQQVSWKTMQEDEVVNLTPKIIIAIFLAVMTMGNTVHQIGRNHRAAMKLSADPLNYNHTTGWPPIFGE